MRECDCEEWGYNIAFLSFVEGMVIVKGVQYKGAKFRFCPWCGESLVDTKKEYYGNLF